MAQRTPLQPISAIVRRNEELSPFLRGQIIALNAAGLTNAEISQRISIPLGTIKTTIRRNAVRIDGETRARSGRPRKLSRVDRRNVLRLI